jgi:hypothetical protein
MFIVIDKNKNILNITPLRLPVPYSIEEVEWHIKTNLKLNKEEYNLIPVKEEDKFKIMEAFSLLNYSQEALKITNNNDYIINLNIERKTKEQKEILNILQSKNKNVEEKFNILLDHLKNKGIL